jgi:hypothetical protein
MNIFELYKPLLLRRFQSSNHAVYLYRVHTALFYVPQSILRRVYESMELRSIVFLWS